MSKEKNKYMTGIIKIEDALKWFENPPETTKDAIDYRGEIKGKRTFTSFTEFEKAHYKEWRLNLSCVDEYYAGIGDVVEADSSPEAWEHYRRHYSAETFGNTQNGSEYSFSFLGYKNPRLFSISENASKKKRKSKKGRPPKSYPVTASGLERLGGECDFNFNESHCSIFIKTLCNILSRRKIDLQEQFKSHENDSIKLLEKCYEMHHTLLNFSLMQGMGNMQGIKRCCNSERFDVFLCYLNSYFKIADKDIAKQVKKLQEKEQPYHKSKNNIMALRHYLNQFEKKKIDNNEIPKESYIYNYCAKIYFLPTENYYTGMMEDEKVFKTIKPLLSKKGSDWNTLLTSNANLINALIESGKMPLNSSVRVEEYMRLAVHFWKAKEKYFELMDKVLDSTDQ